MEYDKEKEKINKQKNILKKVSFIILALEAIFFTSEEIIDLAFTMKIDSSLLHSGDFCAILIMYNCIYRTGV